jgi:hypothetical protein
MQLPEVRSSQPMKAVSTTRPAVVFHRAPIDSPALSSRSDSERTPLGWLPHEDGVREFPLALADALVSGITRRTPASCACPLLPRNADPRPSHVSTPLRNYDIVFSSHSISTNVLAAITRANVLSSYASNSAASFFRASKFVSCDIVLFALGKAVNENRSHASPEYDQRPNSAGLPLARARDALLNHSAAHIGGNQTSFRIPYRRAQGEIRNAGLVSKTGEGLRSEDAHPEL